MTKRKQHKIIDNIEYKICGKCKKYLTLDNYNNSSTNWDKLRNRCKECLKKIRMKNRLNNKMYNKYYYLKYNIPSKYKPSISNKKTILFSKKSNNIDKIQKQLINNLRNRVSSVLRHNDIVLYETNIDLFGCDIPALIHHIESQFIDGMSWENYGQWHCDHIIPFSSFNIMDHFERHACSYYKNLQPLTSYENLSKHAKYLMKDKLNYMIEYHKTYMNNYNKYISIEEYLQKYKDLEEIQVNKHNFVFVLRELIEYHIKKKFIEEHKYNPQTTTRKCVDCKIQKTLINFPKYKSKKYGYAHRCFECNRLCSKNYKLNNKQKISEYNKHYRENNKAKIQGYYKKSELEKAINKKLRRIKNYSKFCNICISFGALCLSEARDYRTAHNKLLIQCSNNHKFNRTLNNLNKRRYCPECRKL